MNLREFAKEAHANAISKGWWQVDKDGKAIFESRPFGELMMLALSEIAEAFEIARTKDFDPKKIWYSGMPLANDVKDIPDELHRKPEGFGIELADFLIRILETAEAGKLNIWEWTTETKSWDFTIHTGGVLNIGSALMDICSHISSAHKIMGEYEDGSGDISIGRAVSDTLALCKILDIDIFNLIELKHRYNQTRPHRHGGKRC